jgi:hypothetical protein
MLHLHIELCWNWFGKLKELDMPHTSQTFSDLYHRKINACCTVHHNRNDILPNSSLKHLQLERGDTVSRVQGNLMTARKKAKQRVYVPSNLLLPPAEGNFKEGGKAVKPLIIEDYTSHISYVDFSYRMVNS